MAARDGYLMTLSPKVQRRMPANHTGAADDQYVHEVGPMYKRLNSEGEAISGNDWDIGGALSQQGTRAE
jgi:hypothetical protein